MQRTRPLLSVFLAITVSSLILVSPSVAAEEEEPKAKHLGALGAGDSIFWDGPVVEDAGVDFPQYPVNVAEAWAGYLTGKSECEDGCFYYEFDVTESADRLRIGLENPIEKDLMDGFYFYVYGPHGNYVDYGRGWFSQEVILQTPAVGTWRVEVVPYHATNSTFRMRAKLENQVPCYSHAAGSTGACQPSKVAGRKPKLMAPNLRIHPPTHFGFTTPPHWAAPWSEDYPYTPCTPDETVDDGSTSCLRLTVGIQNTGDGPLELMYSSIVDLGAKMFQRLTFSDGSSKMREAGTYEYHETHGHYHFAGFAKLDIFHVMDPETGAMEYADKGYKLGFCLGDTVISEWGRFAQDPLYSAQSDCDAPQQAWMGLSRGWTDLYGWYQAGNYVRWPDEDGRYVVRAMADGMETLVETNEKDNWGYAYIEVKGDDITVLERGRGKDPWDPNKVVVRDWWEKRLK